MTPFASALDPSAAPLALSSDELVSRLLDVPLRIAITIVVAILVMLVVRITIHRFTERLATHRPRAGRLAGTELGMALRSVTGPSDARRAQRTRTVGSALLSLCNVLIALIAVLLILDALQVNIAPFLASAGIAGVALGFGAQTLVKDFLSGMFMLLEDQYGVGDNIVIGDVSGTVESVAMRVTTVRDYDGTLWYVRNGEILSVGNRTQGWARAIVEVDVPADVDLDLARGALDAATEALRTDPDVAPLLLEDPSVTGVEQLSAASLTLRMVVRTAPGEQWGVARAMRVAIRDALHGADVSMTPGQVQAVVLSERTEQGPR